MTTLETTLAPQTVEQRQLERQLQGAAPWFTEADFRPAWRRNGTIESVRVTVVTAAHSGADTRNYVYFRTGGHKYLLGAPAHPMSPASGPQEFNLDLALAPLNAGDVRGYALGMLAHGEPCGEAPDRWHPERLRVEIDGRVVYDSEDNTIDRTSLTAIRLVPPAHYELAGQIHENTPIARETFVWEAGTGAGLDLVHGGTEPLPAEGDADYPAAEPGLLTGDELAGAEEIPWHAGDVLPFPGEEDFGPMWDPGLGPWEPGWEPGWGPGWEPGPDWFDMAMFGLLEHFGLLPDWVIPDPVGNPPQLETVTVDTTDQSIHWTVTGDASQIDHFVVDVLLVRPDLDVPYVQTISDPVNVPAAQRSLDWAALTMHPLVATFDEQTRHYRVVRVTIVPTTPIGVDPGFSPALPMRRTQNPTQLQITPTYVFTPLGGLAEVRPLSLAGEPATTDATAWVVGQVDTHNGLVFGNLSPQQHHVVARTIHDGDRIRLRFTGSLGQGRWRLIAMIGFQGALETATSVDVEANCLVHVPGDPTTSATYTPTVHLDGDPMAAPTPLRPLMIDIDTQADVGVAGPMDFRLSYSFTGTNVDPRHPPMLVGLRLIEAP